VTKSGDDVEHGIEILTLFALTSHFDELFNGSHPSHQIVFRANFRYNPKHFPINQLSKHTQNGKG
jgi:hypothetical protein